MTKTIAKQKTKTSKIKTETRINESTRTTIGMGEIQENLHHSTHRVRIFKVKIQALGYYWGCVSKKLRRK